MKKIMKWPLIIAIVVIALRILLEEMGAPSVVNNIFGVTWLYFPVPVYFAITIAASRELPPFKTLIKLTLLYAVCTRLMVFGTYSMAYIFQWSAPRFSLQGGGVVGEGVTVMQGMLITPATNLLIGVILATVIGLITGSATLILLKHFRGKSSDV